MISDRQTLHPQLWNLYNHAGNNPLAYTDPTGMERVKLGQHTDEEIKQRQKEIDQQLKDKTLTKEQKEALKAEKRTLNLERQGNGIVGGYLDALDTIGERQGSQVSDFTLSTDSANDFNGVVPGDPRRDRGLKMRATKNICLILFSVAACLLLTPAAALSCTCELPSPGKTIAQQVREAGEKSKAVFSGKVVGVVDNPQAPYVEVRVEVGRAWKHVRPGEVNLRTGRGGYCGYPFEVGESYLVYAYEYTESELGTNICQRTMKLADAGQDLEVLGKGEGSGLEVLSVKSSPYAASKAKRNLESRQRPPAVRSESSLGARTSRRAAKAATAHVKLAVKSNIKASPALRAGGVFVLGERYDKGDVVNLYNKDGSLWLRLDFYDDKAVADIPPDLRPFAYHPAYFLLALRYAGREDNHFEVVVNEETGLKKYVRADDPVLKFQTWEEHILKAFAVDFDREENQVLETPGGKAKRLKLDKEVLFHPVEVEGEWVKVRWNQTADEKANDSGDVGWIRWRREGVILIELFYFA